MSHCGIRFKPTAKDAALPRLIGDAEMPQSLEQSRNVDVLAQCIYMKDAEGLW